MESSRHTGDRGVLCSLVLRSDGSLRVVLDDVSKGAAPGAWLHRSLFTFKDYPAGTLDPASLPESQLAEFGFDMLARLVASNGLTGDLPKNEGKLDGPDGAHERAQDA